MFSCEVDFGIPSRGMEFGSTKFLQSWNIWPLPGIEDAGSIDEKMTIVVNNTSRLDIRYFDLISTPFFIPKSTGHLMIQFNVLPELVLISKPVKVAAYFCRSSVHRRPVGIGFKAPCIDVGRYITSTSEPKV